MRVRLTNLIIFRYSVASVMSKIINEVYYIYFPIKYNLNKSELSIIST